MPFPWNDASIRADFISPRQIVVASDLTDTELLPHVAAQAKASNAAVTLVHVMRSSPIERPKQDIKEEVHAQQILGQMKDALEMEGVRCSLVGGRGAPAEVVGREIGRTQAGRLIIGTHPHGQCGPNMIGSVANALLLTATVPVCVIGPEMRSSSAHAARARRILHPVQPSGHYREGACFAAEIAQAYGAELMLLHVMKSASATGPYAKVLEAKAQHDLEAFVWPPDLSVRTIVEYGEPVKQILHFAAVENVDWIVMGISHDFPWWSMQNSHAYQVIAESGCPVLTFRHRVLAQPLDGVGAHITASLGVGLI